MNKIILELAINQSYIVQGKRHPPTSYGYSRGDPLRGRIGRRRKWIPKIGMRMITALADFIIMSEWFRLKLFSNSSFSLHFYKQ